MPHSSRTQDEQAIGRDLPDAQLAPDGPSNGALNTLKSALGSIAGTVFEAPGIKQAIAATEAVSTRAYGTISAEAAAHKGVIEDVGWGGWAASFLNPFDEDIIRAKFNENIGLDGDEGLWGTLSKTADWQRNRKSAFFGEKFLGEMLFDPLNFVPLGAATKVIGRAGRIARRTPEQITQIKQQQLGNIQDPKSIMKNGEFADNGTKAPLGTAVGFDDNRVRRIATAVYKRAKQTPLGILAFPFKLINPSGVLRIGTKDMVDKAEIRTYIYARQLEEANGVIAADLANMRLQEMNNVFDIGAKNIAGTDQIIAHNVARKPGVAGKTDEVLMGEVMEFPDRFVLSTAQRELIDEGYRVIDGYKKVLARAKIPLDEAVLSPDQHYWPRFLEMYTEFRGGNIARKGAAIGKEPSMMKQRFWDEFGEGAVNGVPYLTKYSTMPLSDVVQMYMNMTLKQVIDQGYMDDLLEITKKSGLDIRKLKAKGPGTLHFKILNGRQQVSIIRRAVNALDEWHKTGKPIPMAVLSELDTLVPDIGGGVSRELSRELRDITNPFVINKKGKRVYRADPTKLAGDSVTRSQLRRNVQFNLQIGKQVAAYKKKLRNLESNADVDIKTALVDRDDLVKSIKRREAYDKQTGKIKPFPDELFSDPTFNTHLFPTEVVDRIMPKLATREQLLRNKRFLSETLGAAAGFGRVARSFQLTYDIGVQFLQGATVAAASPIKWLTATRKMLSSWNNPQKHMEYLSDPKTQEVLQKFQGRIHIGSSEFTEALRAGATFSRTVGRIRPIGRATEKFRTSFDTFGDVARIEMAKAFLPALDAGKITADQIANHVNKMTGISSSRKLGIGATQREIESAAISLAPNYLRATVGLMADAAQILLSPNRFESQQALFALTKFFGGTVIAYVAICEALGQEPKLNPREMKDGGHGGAFMTVVVDGQRVGLGTKPYSIMRRVTSATIALEEGNQKEAAAQLGMFFRGQTAPMTSTLWDVLSGKTAIEEPVQTKREILGNVSSRLLPFWAEAAINDDPGPSAFGTAADFVGLRSQALSYSAMRSEVRDELAARFPKKLLTDDQRRFMTQEVMDEPTWKMLSKVQQRQIERGEIKTLNRAKVRELQRFEEVMKERRKRIGDVKAVAYFEALDAAKSRLEIETEKHQIQYEEDELSPYEFRRAMLRINTVYGHEMKTIHAADGVHEEYFHDRARQREERQRRGEFEPIEDIARQEYLDTIVSSPDLDNYRGADGYNFRERERREDLLRQKYGSDVIDNIKRDFLMNKNVGLLYKQLQIDKEDLAPYWDIQNNYIDTKPVLRALLEQLNKAESTGNTGRIQQIKATSRYRAMNIDTRRDKKSLLMSRPRLDALLRFWGYTSTLQTKEAEGIYRELIRNAKSGILRE